MDGLEKEMGTMKEDLRSIKNYLLELREWTRLRDEKEESQSRGKGKITTMENSNSGDSGNYD